MFEIPKAIRLMLIMVVTADWGENRETKLLAGGSVQPKLMSITTKNEMTKMTGTRPLLVDPTASSR